MKDGAATGVVLASGEEIMAKAVISNADPRRTLLAFLESAYEAGAGAAGWDVASLASSWCPPGVAADVH